MTDYDLIPLKKKIADLQAEKEQLQAEYKRLTGRRYVPHIIINRYTTVHKNRKEINHGNKRS